jgi:hypothetical protein
MTQPTWQEINNPNALPGAPRVYWRQLPDGSQQSCTEDCPLFQDWLAEGNEPLPADELS